jgi:hypothetical protein
VGKEESSDHEEGGNSDSGSGCSQQSESESSGSCVVLEIEDDSTKLSQASSEEHSEASEEIRPSHISLLGDLTGKLLLY